MGDVLFAAHALTREKPEGYRRELQKCFYIAVSHVNDFAPNGMD